MDEKEPDAIDGMVDGVIDWATQNSVDSVWNHVLHHYDRGMLRAIIDGTIGGKEPCKAVRHACNRVRGVAVDEINRGHEQ